MAGTIKTLATKQKALTLFVSTQIKKVVYKNRIRLKEFLVDFDKVCLEPSNTGRSLKQAKLLTSAMCLVSNCKFVCVLQLRSGFIFENQFLSGLSMAGLDKQLTAAQLQA